MPFDGSFAVNDVVGSDSNVVDKHLYHNTQWMLGAKNV